MAGNQNRDQEARRSDPLSNNLERKSSVPNDLPDTPEDEKKLESKDTVINLPEVKDIPGQEFVNAPRLGEMADTTISSADEEGARIFDKANLRGTDFEVRADERHTLERTDYMPTTDEDNLERASMDNVDFHGEVLNEKGFGEALGDSVAGDDLDTDTGEDETENTSIGETDEENKYFSLGSADNDNVTEGTP
ncbi:MAG: hypothetical protein ACM3VS_14970 [Candidatus Dadabacteria bacterium]